MASYRAAVQVAVVASSLVLSVTACRKDAPSPSSESAPAIDPKAAAADTPRRDEPSLSPKADISRLEKAAALVGLADGLPDLKPVIGKPFPAGATEEQVCEAINDADEKDLWVRFGHLVPMHVNGTLYVLEGKPADAKRVKHYVENDYIQPRRADVMACSSNGTILVYIRNMLDDVTVNGHRFGRQFLSEQLKEKLKLRTREMYRLWESKESRERLSDYCRADAELCESLVKLDPMNQTGLCGFAIAEAGADANREQHLPICEKLPNELTACAHIRFTPDENTEEKRCTCRLRQAFHLPHDPCP